MIKELAILIGGARNPAASGCAKACAVIDRKCSLTLSAHGVCRRLAIALGTALQRVPISLVQAPECLRIVIRTMGLEQPGISPLDLRLLAGYSSPSTANESGISVLSQLLVIGNADHESYVGLERASMMGLTHLPV